ncbi:MAG: diacylglycerol kinase family protein [Xanthomonadales bacterium]|nr:diacylglycerol kinase family protein [Xanthomonadales bacterium]
MRYLLVFNPHAAAGRAARLREPVRAALERLAQVDLHLTQAPGDARAWLAQADLGGYDGVIAAGGDGTLFEVLNGLYSHEAGRRPPLGVVPIGTGNAFARDLGLAPGDWEKGIDLIAGQKTRHFDTGRVESAGGTFHFLNIIGAGLPGDVMQSSQRLKVFGRAAYSVATLWKAVQMHCRQLKITLDGAELERDSLFVEISNTRYTGTSFLIAPGAEADDGLLDITLVGRLSRLRVLRLFPSIYQGKHVEYDEVETFRAREIRIESAEALPLAPDGELEGLTPVTVRCLHRDLVIYS